MLNTFARILLVCTSLAPMLLVAGVSWIGTGAWVRPVVPIGVAILLCLVALLLLALAQNVGERRELVLSKIDRADKNVLAFMFTYVLPLLTPIESLTTQSQKLGGTLALMVFVFLIGTVLFQTQLHNVNPVLGLVGYRFFEVEAKGHNSLLLMSRRTTLPKDVRITAIGLSDTVWLEVAS